MPDSIRTPANKPRRFGIATAFMTALAGGALWGLLSLRVAGDLAPFALVVAAVVVWVLRAHGYGGRWSGVVLAPLCVACATVYACYLQAAARIAAMLGLPLREALWRMQPAFAFDLVRVNLGGSSLLAIALALLVAAAAMWPRPRR